MNDFFGVVSGKDCIKEVFYGTDYYSRLGTKRAGIVFIVPEKETGCICRHCRRTAQGDWHLIYLN
jgi:hypothetical protein